MKTIRHNFTPKMAILAFITTLPLLLAPVLSGCTWDRDLGNLTPDITQEVVFSINVPGSSASTRALGEEAENEVASIEMLLFDPSTGKLAANPVFADVITSDPDGDGDYRRKLFSVRVPAGRFDVMVFANARKAFNGTVIGLGDAKATAIAKLETSMPAGGWVTDPDHAAKGYLIPMWGQKNDLLIEPGTTISGIWLHRCLARIDLTVSDVNTGGFQLQDIKLYNAQKTGRVAPVAANWNPAGLVNGSVAAGLATAPSLVTGCGVHPAISYASAIAADKKSCMREIYLLEAPRATAHADRNAPFLTVKGTFNGVDGWYRIDLADYTNPDNPTYLDVLRNHLYKIRIDKVTGTGYTDEQDAIDNMGSNIVVNITLWNEYDLGSVIAQGPCFLAINPQDIAFDADWHTSETLTIRTDREYADAPTIRVSASPNDPAVPVLDDWINDVELSGPDVVNGKNVYTLVYDVDENLAAERTGYIHVTHGPLTLVVRIKQSYGGSTISITEQVILGAEEHFPAAQRIRVTCLKYDGTPDPNFEWSLATVDPRKWLSIGFTNRYSQSDQNINGQGTMDVYLFLEANTYASERSNTLFLCDPKGNVLQMANVIQLKDLPPLRPVTTRNSCVGAFWKHDQIGERVIQINMAGQTGKWLAQVAFYDNNWSPQWGDGVLLSTGGSADGAIGTENPGDAESFNLLGHDYTDVISGNLAPGENEIVFRIGLEQAFGDYSATPDYSYTYPARYAVVELWYADYRYMQRIYLRQGEGDDYVMSRLAPDNREAARRFSPYNLTADILNMQVTPNGVEGLPQVGRMTDYPTQAGAFFQWVVPTGVSGLRYAWAPYGEVTEYWMNFSIDAGTIWKDENESCPAGYRRPWDGGVGTSELRHSLFEYPSTISAPGGNGEVASNAVYGYYADGFYDRRPVVRNNPIGNISTGIVAQGTRDVAYGGRLFYNPTTNASLFFPVGGYRRNDNGNLSQDGYYGYYQTRSEYSGGGTVLALRNEDFTLITHTMKNSGNMVRCIKP